MPHVTNYFTVDPILTHGSFESGFLKPVRMVCAILMEQLAYSHSLLGQTRHITRYQRVQLQLPPGRLAMTELIATEHLTEMFFRQSQQLPCRLAACINKRTYLRTVLQEIRNVRAISFIPIPVA